MFRDNLYVQLLANKTYFNLDEAGTAIPGENVIDNGYHSIAELIIQAADRAKIKLNRGKDWHDHCFIEEVDSLQWAGPVRWFQGSLHVIHGSPYFPPNRELLFFHRPERGWDYPSPIYPFFIEDMIKYGYLLPNWTPLLSRVMCLDSLPQTNSTLSALREYKPYQNNCIAKWKG